MKEELEDLLHENEGNVLTKELIKQILELWKETQT